MLNRCEFIGNLGADPEVRATQAGKKIVSFRIACTEKWTAKDGDKKEKTEWIPIVIFSEHLAKIAEQYLRKGSKIYVSGQFSTRKWQDQNGNDRYSTEVVLRPFSGELTFLDKPEGGGQSQQGGYGSGGRPSNAPADLDDEIPFSPEWRV